MLLLVETAPRQGSLDYLLTGNEPGMPGVREGGFAIIYLVGTLVTVFLSNDATAVVTLAVCAVARAAKVNALPYLFVCAFIANAASFVLPISNPAKLVIYADHMPTLPV